MICKNCGKEIDSSASFCGACGATQAGQIDPGAFQSALENSAATAAAPKKSPRKFVIIGVIAALLIIVIACAAGGGEGGGVIIENEDCQLGAAYNMTPEQYIERYNAVIEEIGGNSTLCMPSLDEWTAADLSEDGNTTYMYCVSKELIYWIYTYQDDKVTLATVTLGDSLIGNGCLYMAVMECAALNISDKDTFEAMFELFSERIYEGYTTFCYQNSVITVDGNDLRIAAVSDAVLDTMEYYSIAESELK